MTHKEFEGRHGGRRDQSRPGFRASDLRATAEAKVKTAYKDANRQLQAKIREVEQDRPSMKAQMDSFARKIRP